MKKSNLKFMIIVILVIMVVVGIFYLKSGGADDEVLKCIAENSKLYVSKTCSHCAEQKMILGDGLKYFNLVDCADNPIECIGITAIPTWEINGQRTSGVKSIEQLKELTGC